MSLLRASRSWRRWVLMLWLFVLLDLALRFERRILAIVDREIGNLAEVVTHKRFNDSMHGGSPGNKP